MGVDRNPNSPLRNRRNWQHFTGTQGASVIIAAVKSFTKDGETPSGAVDGTNVTFTTVSAPDPNTIKVYLNGVRLLIGGSNDFALSGNSITFAIAPKPGDIIQVDYLKASL